VSTAKDSLPEQIPFKEFLERVPPGTFSPIKGLGGTRAYPVSGGVIATLVFPEITLHCVTEGLCGGDRIFRTRYAVNLGKNEGHEAFVHYQCKNCSKNEKIFALWVELGDDLVDGQAYKYGEVPNFGPPNPPRLITLIRGQRDLFVKGRRAENQGMGIAAFAYYRRVIDDQRARIFDEIIKVCQRLSADQTIIDELTAAKTETQFTKAVEVVKHGIPQALLINEENPLTLLHSALSAGLHGKSDEECLADATNIRIVMAEFAERMGQALKDEAELSSAVAQLIKKKAAAAKPEAGGAVSTPEIGAGE
jgi:hypothetical protein